MLVKIYWSSWGLLALAFPILLVSNNLTMFNLVVVGFIAFGLTFMGMMAVLPTMVAHPVALKQAEVKPIAIRATREAPSKAFHVFKSA